jgi:hypothetical protein
MQSTLSLLLFGTVTTVTTILAPSIEPTAAPSSEPAPIAVVGEKTVVRVAPKCDALPGGFHWRYEDVPKMPNPTGYYWQFAELPQDVKNCWSFGPCAAPQKAAASRTVTVPGGSRKGN